MKRTIAYLIRHGEIDNPMQVMYGRTIDLSLSQEGVRQIQVLVDTIKKRNDFPVGIYSSPLRRTVQTAEVLSAGFSNTQIFKEDDLNEIASLNVDGKPLSLLAELICLDQETIEKQYGIENPSDVVRRMKRVFGVLLKKNAGKTFFIVSHGDPLALLFWSLLNTNITTAPSRLQWAEKYLEKGECWRLVLNSDGIETYDTISQEE